MSVTQDLKDLIDDSEAVIEYEKRDVFIEQYIDSSKRYLLVRRNPLASDEYERNSSYSIWFIGAVNDLAIDDIESDANSLVKYFLQNYTKGCIINVEVVGDIAGPYLMDSNRYFYKIDVNVKSATS